MGKTLNINPATAPDYRRLSEAKLPRFLFDYIDGGANEELSLAANTRDFRALRIRQQILRDISAIDTRTTLAGETVDMPVVLAPVGMAGMMARRGEVQGVRAACAAGIPFTLSTVGICPIAEVQAAASRPIWFQLYMVRDRGAVKALLDTAAARGVTTLVFTVDLPMAGMRHRDTRNGMLSGSLRGRLGKAWQLGTRPGWLVDVGLRGTPHTFGNLADVAADASDLTGYKAWMDSQFDCSVTWKDMDWLRSVWKGRIIIKGLQEVNDAQNAVAVGADGIVVSNHGGRQLDAVASSISKLPAIADAVGDKLEVLMDGGVRGGLDVFKAVAQGARGVLIGRPWVWAVSGAGEAGLRAYLATLKRELEVGMALAGVTRIADIRREMLDVPDARQD